MTINLSDNSPRISYTVNQGATQSAFVVPFEFFDDDDLNVYVDGTKKTLTTHYTTADDSGNSQAHTSGTTGYIHFTSGNHVTGASGGSTVIITRDIDFDRVTDFPTSGPFDVASLNTELDRMIGITADLNDETTRSLRLEDEDSSVAMTLPLKAARVGTVLGFNATTGAPEAGPTIANVNSLSAITANINTVAGISANVTTVAGIASNTTSVANIASNVTSVAGNASNINAAVSNASNINTVAGSISNVNAVGAKASLITSDFVSDLNTLAVTDVINDINTLATSDIVSDLNTLATSDIVSDLNTLATSDIVSDINTLATSDIVTDLNLLATSDFVSDLNTLATSGNVTAVNNVSGSIANVNTVANNLTTVNTFGTQYQVSANAPGSPTEGLLWFDTTNNIMKVYDGSGFINAGSSVNGTANRFAYTVGTSSGSYNGSTTVFPATYDAGFVDVYLNGVKLLVGTDATATNGSSVTLASAAATADIVEIVAYGTFTAATELSLLDNKKIQLGTSQDLQIYHNGSGSFIDEAGTGDLYIRSNSGVNINKYTGETMIYAVPDGAVNLYHNNAAKLATTATGVDVTGTATVDGLTVQTASGDATGEIIAGGGTSILNLGDASDKDAGAIKYANASDSLQFFANAAERMRISSSGLVGIGTASPSTFLDVEGSGVPFEINSTASNTYKVQFKNAGTLTSYLGTTANAFHFANASATQLARIDSDGVKFGTDSAAGNGLGDYEEGTYTVTDVSGQGLSINSISGTYTKIGRLVHVNLYIFFPASTNSTQIQLSLPYAAGAQASSGYSYLNGRLQNGSPLSFESAFSCQVNVSSSGFYVGYHSTTDGAILTYANLSSRYLLVSGCYHTDT